MGDTIQLYCEQVSGSIPIYVCVGAYVHSFWFFGTGLVLCIVGLMLKQTKSSRSVSRCIKAVFIGGVLQMLGIAISSWLKAWKDRISYAHIDSCGKDIEDFFSQIETIVAGLEISGVESGFPLFMRGISAGACLSMYMAQTESARISGIVMESLCEGAVEPETYGLLDTQYMPLLVSKDTMHAGMPPMLQIHGANDNLCAIEQSAVEIGEKARELGLDWGLITSPFSAHTVTLGNTYYAQMTAARSVEFYDSILADWIPST
ncbi:hypothetical protein KIPB_005603 [Kipferlia bialata]|uniref:Uncharacterized protein n=1 Tax=Kipferlia bialata TaxID=797122 RepID=A0A9K3CVN9_9EUKA|nr:hypothetical protein KIPB_005603 [Kipferlia bialata]|eukprot:g5603.t1